MMQDSLSTESLEVAVAQALTSLGALGVVLRSPLLADVPAASLLYSDLLSARAKLTVSQGGWIGGLRLEEDVHVEEGPRGLERESS